MFIKSLDFTNYLKYKKNINEFILDEQWRNTIMFDSLFSEIVHGEVVYMINFFTTNPSVSQVDEYLKTLRIKSTKILATLDKESITEELKWSKAREAYALYGLGEIITEGSTYSEAMPKELMEEYGDKYLEILSEVDVNIPSRLTNFNSRMEKKDMIIGGPLQKYTLLKKWQDDQNIYHNSSLFPLFSKFRDEFKVFYVNTFGNVDCGAREMLALYKLRREPFITAAQMAILIDVGMEKELVSVWGGKNYGLAVLANLGITIPQTYCLPIAQKSLKVETTSLNKRIKYAVRSSADCEDGDKNSFAGMFDSYLNIPINELNTFIQKVKDSIINPRVVSYVKKFGLRCPQMSVIVQEFIEPDISGVWLGQSQEAGILEWVQGRGDKLVSGKITPVTERFTKSAIDKTKYLSVNGNLVGEILVSYQKQIGAICDFEWCIKNNQLFMLQYRPVTAIIYESKSCHNSSIKGTPASKGKAIGKTNLLEDCNQVEDFQSESILLTYYTDPDWVEIMTKASGIITAEGGFLCHTAIIARELGLPCITGIGEDNLLNIGDNTEVEMNGYNGDITILNRKN